MSQSPPPSRETDVPAEERDALVTIAHGAVLTGNGVSIQRGLSAVIEWLLTHHLGPAAYGVYAFGWRLVSMFLWFANLGANVTLQRDIPAFTDEPGRQRIVVGLAYVTTAVTAVSMAAVVALTVEPINAVTIDEPSFPPVLRLFALLLVVLAFIRLHAYFLRAGESAFGAVLINRVLRPLGRLLAVVIAIVLGYAVAGVVAATVLTLGVLAVGGYRIATATTGISPAFHGMGREARSFYNHAVPSALTAMGRLLRIRIDVLLVGTLLGATEAGVYNVVLVLIGIVAIPLGSFNQLMPPVASDLYADGRVATLDRVYTTVARLIVTATVPFAVVMLVYGRELLGLFGPTYVQGYVVLVVFLVGRFVANAVGATGWLLAMTNHQYARLVLDWLLAVANVTLTYLLVVEYGLVGAALGTSIAIGGQNLIQVVLLRHYEGLWPFDRTFLPPLAAGVAMGAVMAVVGTVLDGGAAIVVGSAVGLVTFVLVLDRIGLERSDRLVVRELSAQYGRFFGDFGSNFR